MSDPFIGEIKLFGCNFAPKGWALCNGQLLPINQNQALFSILGTTYGGNGQTNFALPDLRGRVPVHVGNGVTLGQSAGEETHTLTTNEMPQHIHLVSGSSTGPTTPSPAGNLWSNNTDMPSYATSGATAALNAAAISPAGGSQPHENRQPYLTLNYCIALMGIFPSRS